MGILGKAQAAGWLLVAATAGAQTAKPDAAAEAAAAMERAKRQAAGPMRIILEASKARRKAGEAEAAPAAEPVTRGAAVKSGAPAAPAAAAVTSPGAIPAPGDARLLVATNAAGDATRAQAKAAPAAELAQPATAAAAPPAPLAEPPPAATLSSQVLQTKQAGVAVPSLEAGPTQPLAGSAAFQAAPVPVAPSAVAAATAEPLKPRLVSMVEPELSQRLLDQLGRNATVLIDLNIRADGSVAGITVLPPSSRQLERALAPTLEQWRFEPLPSARVHRVELVFNTER